MVVWIWGGSHLVGWVGGAHVPSAGKMVELCVCGSTLGFCPRLPRFRGSGQDWPLESQVQEGSQMSTGSLPSDVHSGSVVEGRTY